jgi:hypothetical protein
MPRIRSFFDFLKDGGNGEGEMQGLGRGGEVTPPSVEMVFVVGGAR